MHEDINVAGAVISRKMREQVEIGKHINRIPIGYMKVWTGTSLELMPDPTSSPLVRESFELLSHEGISLRAGLIVMSTKGICARNGKSMGLSTFHDMVRNPFYAGFIKYGGKQYKGIHQPIISPELFRKVEKNLAKKRC